MPCHTTAIAEQLKELGVDISTGQISNIIIHNKERFHREKDQILTTGLKISGHINVDDTGARHNGANGYCTHIGNDLFAWFKSTKSKNKGLGKNRMCQPAQKIRSSRFSALGHRNCSIPVYQKLAIVDLVIKIVLSNISAQN